MKLASSKEREVHGRMDRVLLEKRYLKVAESDDTSSYRNRFGVTVNLFRQESLHDPIKAVIAGLPSLGAQTAYNGKGLAILLDDVEAMLASRVPSAAERYHDALDRAAGSYRDALRHVVEECSNDKPRIDHIREVAEQGLRAADAELARAGL